MNLPNSNGEKSVKSVKKFFTPLVQPLIRPEKVAFNSSKKKLRFHKGVTSIVYTLFNYTVNLFLHSYVTRVTYFYTLILHY